MSKITKILHSKIKARAKIVPTQQYRNRVKKIRNKLSYFCRQVQKVTLDPGQMVQLMRNEQPLSESLPLMLNSISNQEESQTGPGSNPIVRLDSQQLELLMMHQKEMNQESSQCARKAS